MHCKLMLILCNFFLVPSSGLYFMLGTTIYLPGDSVFITDIGDQPSDRSDPGLTLVCVTTNVNTACCRRRDNYYYYDRPLGEWYFPNGTTVPSGAYSDLYRVRFIYQMRLAKANSSTGPLGAYRCEVPDGETGENVSATINLTTQSKLLIGWINETLMWPKNLKLI